MFDVRDREELRARLVAAARRDPEIDAAAVLGSAARGTEDRWSDIDLAFGLARDAEPRSVAERWTTRLQREEDVVDHLDVHASGGLYRVFLLASTLQVDLSFWPHRRLATGGAPAQLLFGQVNATALAPAGDGPTDHLRMAWLYALHVRSALARGRSWQAVWMLEALRNRLISLYCVRHGLTAHEGRGVDQLPDAVRSGLARTLIPASDPVELGRTFGVLVALLLAEAGRQALPVPAGLAAVLDDLVASSRSR